MRITGLPFVVDVHGDPRSGGPATLRIGLQPPMVDERFDQLRCVVGWFAQLGEWGALSGDTLALGSSSASLPTGEPDARTLHPMWQFDALAVDPRAVTILANLVFATGLTVRSFELRAAGATDPQVLACDAYPARPQSLPFSVHEDRTSRNVNVAAQFAADVPATLQDPLTDVVRVWCMLAALGGFRERGPLRERMDLDPEDEPEVVLDELRFSFRDNGVHEAAYDALVGLLGACSRHGARVSAVTVD
jgi:hypothetical protein